VNEFVLAMSGAWATSIVAKVTVTIALGLFGAWLARRSPAAVRHALLTATFGVLLVLPAVSLVAPPLRVFVQERSVPALASSTAINLPVEAVRTKLRAASEPPRSNGPSLSMLLFTGWMAGMALFLTPVVMGLWEVRSLRRSALPWRRAQPVVDRLAREAGIQRGVEVLLHATLPGPMTCGALHPAVVLPQEAETWEAEDLTRAILHELEHVRRADWLSHCLARALCAVYWFHPLVWIAWRQLTLDAERACDDAVLRRSESTAYADQLVGLARRLSTNAKSPLLAMANRADLATRVSAVLDSRQRRGRAGKVSLGLACGAAVLLVVTISPLQMVAAPQGASAPISTGKFDAVSVKLVDPNVQGEHSHEHSDPKRLAMTGTLHWFIERSYGITDGQLGGEPGWFTTRLYTLEAVNSTPATSDQMMLMLRAALADRFQLKLRQEDRDTPVFAVEVAAGGPKFMELKPGEVARDSPDVPDTFTRSFSSMKELITVLNGVFGGILKLERPIIDRTQLAGRYDMQLQTAIEIQTDDFGKRIQHLPNLSRDMQSELGLKLVPDRVKMPYFVVEQAAAPSPN
jgi:uncharacterized protein (TIGR03435 family)